MWALTLIANVDVGIAERAREPAVAHARSRTSIALSRGTFAHHPLVQHQVAAMHLELSAARAQLDALARDWVTGVDHGPLWGVQVLCEVVGASRTGQVLSGFGSTVPA